MFSETLISFVRDDNELKNCDKIIINSVKITFQECLNVLYTLNGLSNPENLLFKINSVVDFLHDELNTGHWSEVPLDIRRAFTASSFLKAVLILRLNESNKNLKDALKCVDLGLLLGAPLDENFDLLLKVASFLNKIIGESSVRPLETLYCGKRKREELETILSEKSIKIAALKKPSLEKFDQEFHKKQIPVKLQDCMEHWPAMKKWTEVNYLLSVAGERTVPIEIGSHYADDNWGQKLMPLRKFIENYFLKESQSIGYLAQHNLFDQISELQEDIRIPEYCCLSNNYEESCDPDINAWLGPSKTVSPLHYDPKDNILAQVFGTKHLILYAPTDSVYLYPHEDKMLFNTARVDPLRPNLDLYPDFGKAIMYECILEPGEMLYIPSKWWHHVTALDKSFSVSFWWK